VISFEDRSIDSAEAARSLGVDAVLEGTIYRSGDRVRITARLMGGGDQRSPIWTAELERPVADELHLQDEIARRLVDALALELSPAEQLAVTKRYTDSADAHRFYMEGRYHWNKRNYEGLSNARYLFQKAIDADPNFALAYVGLADSMVFVDRNPEINSALGRALELDPSLGETFATLGINHALNEWNWKSSEECLKRSIELNPGYATAHQWYAVLLGIEGRNEDAKAEMQRAIEIDPSSYNYLADLGQIYYFDRDYATAKDYCLKALAINPDFAFAHGYLAQIYFQTGEYELAIHELETADLLAFTTSNQATGSPDKRKAELATYSEGYRKAGLKGFWDSWRAYVEKNAPDRNPNRFYLYARMYASLGDRDQALKNLEQGIEHKPFLMAWVKADPVFVGIRSDVRYQEFLRKMGLS
jgi:tetratricopeptide (TPR) repeat protein